jgi:hypothetical protein
MLFGIMSTWIVILAAGWKAFKPMHWWWLIRTPWEQSASRLFGSAAYTVAQEVGNWVHVPPFKLYRIRSPNNAQKNV